MLYLLLVSFVWAFSFGLIKNQLAGLDSTAVGAIRIALSALVFIPFLRPGKTNVRQRVQLGAIGAIQFGLMYLLYLRAFHYLHGFEIALFTITTPVFIALIEAALRGKIIPAHVVAALLSVAGAGVIVWRRDAGMPSSLTGVMLMQVSNLCFAAGQVAYRRIRKTMTASSDASSFGWLYAGAAAVTLAASIATGAWDHFQPSATQWGVLAYLGILSSGLCFFWWNRGATLVNAGTLAAMNNAKVPLGVACSLVFFHEDADWLRLLLGGGLLAVSVAVAEKNRDSG